MDAGQQLFDRLRADLARGCPGTLTRCDLLEGGRGLSRRFIDDHHIDACRRQNLGYAGTHHSGAYDAGFLDPLCGHLSRAGQVSAP